MLRGMKKLLTGLFGFTLCLLIGILVDQVALGILAGLFLGALFGRPDAKPREDAPEASRDN
jgi:hypothetical protein